MASVENGDRSSVFKDVVVGGSVMVIASSAISEMWCDIYGTYHDHLRSRLTYHTYVC